MAFTPWIDIGHDPTATPGIFPSWYGGWITTDSAGYPDTIYNQSRMELTWENARDGAGEIAGSYATWGFSANASRGVDTNTSTYNATAVQERQIIRLEPGAEMIDSIIDAQFKKWMADRGLVKGVHYDTPPADSRYKTFDWIPQNLNDVEVLPGGYLGFGVWDGGGIYPAETDGYYGVSLEIREWAKTINNLPAVAPQVKEGTNSARLGVAEQGGWPGYDFTGDLLFSWPGFYPALNVGAFAGVNSWDDDDALHAVDLTEMVDAEGRINLSYTSNLFSTGLPPYNPGEPAPVHGGNMNIFGANWRSQSTYLRVIARAYPQMQLPRVRFWATDPVLLRWLNHMSPLVWDWLLQSAWLSIRISVTQSYY